MATVLSFETHEPKQCLDITTQIEHVVRGAGARRGLCHVIVLHATAAIVINENDDPDIGVDLLRALDRAVPDHAGWLHDRVDNNAHAHIKAAILGPSELIPIEGGELQLGRWQGIMLVELDGPRRSRNVAVRILRDR